MSWSTRVILKSCCCALHLHLMVLSLFTFWFAGTNLLQSASCCRAVAGLLRQMVVSGMDESAALHWSHLSFLTCLSSLTINSAVHASLPDLSHMPALHALTLDGYSLPAVIAKSFIHLQVLVLTQSVDAVCNLTSCRQLTKLHVRSLGDTIKQLDLPHGDDVQLQELLLNGKWGQHNDHLVAAQHLTALVLKSAYPSNFCSAGWPAKMPSLRHIQFKHISHQLPRVGCICWTAICVTCQL